MNYIKITQADAKDAALIADLSRQTFYDTFAVYNTADDMNKFMNEQFTREKLMEEVGAGGNIFLLAYSNDEVAGYVRLRELPNDFWPENIQSIEIARIYTVHKYIGQGIGSALMQECLRIARQMNKKLIWLGVWEKNQKAIDFYKKWRFEKFGEQQFVLGNDSQTDWLMKRWVGA